MPHRQSIEFLRRRYAVAILRDDADTAGRLRAKLDAVMNHARRAERPGEAPQPQPQARAIEPPARLIQSPLRSPGAAGERAKARAALDGRSGEATSMHRRYGRRPCSTAGVPRERR